MTIATPFNFNPDEPKGDGAFHIPYHGECGLPVELCNCIDAPVKFEDGQFVVYEKNPLPPAAVTLGAGHLSINLDVEGAEDEARALIEDGWEIRSVTLETSEIQCAACGWGTNTTCYIECPVGKEGPPPHSLLCEKCGVEIEFPVELMSVIQRAIDGRL